MAKVELKQPVVQEIAELFNGAQTAVAVDYRGLTVAEDTQLRKKLREAGITYKVYKNTLIRLAAKDTPYEALSPVLEGPTAIAVSKEDATAPARLLAEFAKTAKKLEIKGGVVEENFYDAEAMQAIASIPSREILLGRLLGSMQSPIANFARVIKQIAEKDGEGAPAAEAAPEA
ncbi:MAG: 50S ribosomal protein L10 [Clostridium sp.]|nr:50S ribosomal protein L10 [Clostridium sp.]